MSKAVVIVSGGLDSCTLLQSILQDHSGIDVLALSFNYGQRHAKELEYAEAFCKSRGVYQRTIDLTALQPLISNSALTSGTVVPATGETAHILDVPEGHYAEENMVQTIVPNRNMIMLSIATGVAVSRGADIVATGIHSGDHFIYPDCRPEFIRALQDAVRIGNEGVCKPHFEFFTPFKRMTKTQIAYLAHQLGVEYAETWSCYKGGENHCGRCGTCVERLEAIYDAGYNAFDTTVYDDKEFWKTAVQQNPEGPYEVPAH